MIELHPMTLTEYEFFVARVVPDYAQEKIASREWDAADAIGKAHVEFQALLPNGLSTLHHHLFSIVAPGISHTVGSLWIQERQHGSRRIAHLLDIFIAKPYRRLGFASQAMLLLEKRVQALGCNEISLHVFGHNAAARVLYESLNFEITDLSMAKRIV